MLSSKMAEPGVKGVGPGVKGAGKKATLQKKQLYANPLPVGRSGPPKTWSEWFKGLLFSQPDTLVGWYDALTCSVWLKDTDAAAQRLWTHGFFGKGNLSRSEPTWTARKRDEITARSQGRLTAEQMTQRRREERKLLKIERAKAAVRAGIQLPDGVAALGGDTQDLTADAGENSSPWQGDEDIPEIESGISRVRGLKYFSETVQQRKANQAQEHSASESESVPEALEEPPEGVEHFQLTMVEAFFLAGMLGCLEVRDAQDRPLSTELLYQLCLISQLPAHAPLRSEQVWARPDNPFLLSYVVYHHFRSLGWVVKNGTKFCVDYLLYKRGPVFSHAEFSVLIIPEYEDERDAQTSPFSQHHNAGEKSWVWFSTMNRVNSQVQKTLILTHVLVPSIARLGLLEQPQQLVKSLQVDRSYQVTEVAIRRWVPARMKA